MMQLRVTMMIVNCNFKGYTNMATYDCGLSEMLCIELLILL